MKKHRAKKEQELEKRQTLKLKTAELGLMNEGEQFERESQASVATKREITFFSHSFYPETVESIKSIKHEMRLKQQKEQEKWDSSTVGGNDR